MLEAMRSKATAWVVRILAVFLILSFGVWGIGDIFRGRSASTDVAEVGDIKITRQELDLEFRRAVDRLRERLGPEFDSQRARQLGLVDQTLDNLIMNRLFGLEAARLGLDAGDDLVRRTIRTDPAFHNRAGVFDAQLFREWLARRNLSETGYVAALRGRIVVSQIAGAVMAGSAVPKTLNDVIYNFRNERRTADVVRIPRTSAAAVPDPDDGTLAEFHRKNAALFTAPEYRDIAVVHLDPEALAAEIKPSQERLRNEYEYRLSRLSVPERRQVQQILTNDEALARRVYRALKEGRDFTEAATAIAGMSAGAIDLGRLRKTDLPPKLAGVAFGLAKGAFSAPIKTTLGWHILRVVAIEPGKAPRFEDVKKEISRELAKEKAIDSLIALANKFEDSLAAGDSLEDAAAKVDARVIRISAIDSEGKDAGGQPVKGIPADPKFLETVFATAAGETSTLVETRGGGFFMVRVNRITPPALRPLAEVRAQVVAAWKRKVRDDAAKTRAEAILEAARASGSLAAVAKERGLNVLSAKPFSRFIRDPDSPMPPELASRLFAIKPGDIAMAADEEGYAVAQLKAVERAEPSANRQEYEQIGATLKQSVGRDLVAQLADALRQRYPVTIDRRAVETLF